MAAIELETDVLIAGGGLVGAALAVALRDSGLRITVAEAIPFRAPGQPSYDDRSTALSYGSRRILEAMQLWSAIEPQVAAIQRVHVSQQSRLGVTRLSAEEEKLPALGYVVPNALLGQVLMPALQNAENIDLRAPSRVVAIRQDDESATATLEENGEPVSVRARLVVAADGAASPLRQLLSVGAREWDYGQQAIVCNITPEFFHQHVAYERFAPDGPMALLPLDQQRMALVLVEQSDIAADVLALDDDAFAARVEQRFGQRLGRFVKVGKRAAYPLSLVTAEQQRQGRCVILGNAAHSLHPIAGQGFNLSLRDVATLAEVIVTHRHDPGETKALESYLDWRRADQRRVVAFTDLLNRLFGIPFTVAAHARGLGLLGLDLFPGARSRFARHAMGRAGRLPKLARGLPL